MDLQTIDFGKYKGETFQSVWQTDRQYCEWCLKTESNNKNLNEFKAYVGARQKVTTKVTTKTPKVKGMSEYNKIKRKINRDKAGRRSMGDCGDFKPSLDKVDVKCWNCGRKAEKAAFEGHPFEEQVYRCESCNDWLLACINCGQTHSDWYPRLKEVWEDTRSCYKCESNWCQNCFYNESICHGYESDDDDD